MYTVEYTTLNSPHTTNHISIIITLTSYIAPKVAVRLRVTGVPSGNTLYTPLISTTTCTNMLSVSTRNIPVDARLFLDPYLSSGKPLSTYK